MTNPMDDTGSFARFPVLAAATAALAVSIFVADTITTIEISFAVLYVLVVLLSAQLCQRNGVLLITGVCVALTALSYAVTPPGGDPVGGIVNTTTISVGVIVLTAVLVIKDQTHARHGREQSETLRQLGSELAHVNRLSMMGELTASLGHEILHPIATARNNARTGMRYLERSPPNLDEVKEALASVVRDADRAKDIVDRIREHIKKAPPRNELFDLNAAIGEVIVMVRNAIDRNRISVRTSFIQGMVSVRGDRVQLQQVVLNLILNAVEAMSSVEEGARQLSISTQNDQASDVLVAVQDSGPGIDPEHLERVFTPFYTTKTNGIGMGLSICRSIVGAHGGRLWAEANRPRGTRFQFTMPGGLKKS
jgi:C4-dicarboxylate-specific signal transduction histidine kinase